MRASGGCSASYACVPASHCTPAAMCAGSSFVLLNVKYVPAIASAAAIVTTRATARQLRLAGSKDRLDLAVTRNRRASEPANHTERGKLLTRPGFTAGRATTALLLASRVTRRPRLDSTVRIEANELANGPTLVGKRAAEDADMCRA